jgi:hypothetical protein
VAIEFTLTNSRNQIQILDEPTKTRWKSLFVKLLLPIQPFTFFLSAILDQKAAFVGASWHFR